MSVEPIAAKAIAAHRALCELEDELDAVFGGAPSASVSDHTASQLLILERRWDVDTHRKIEWAIGKVPS